MDGELFALVTGGGAGIGRATAMALARAGWHVALAGRRREKLDEVAREIGFLGRRAIAHGCDVGDPEAVKGLFATIEKRLRPARSPVQQRRAWRARRAHRRTDLRAMEGGGRRQSQRRLSLRARSLRPDEAPEPAGRADHQQRLDLGPCAPAVLGPLYGDEARDHRPHQIDRPRRARPRHRLRPDRHRQRADRNGPQA